MIDRDTSVLGAIFFRERTGAIDRATRQQALATFHQFTSSNLILFEIEPIDFRTAAVVIEGPGGLRAGDALHPALAKRLSADLASLGRRLADAGQGGGVPPLFTVG
ncbi:type II toxin-antitoxin system VapC family toxin [uncultured Lamprocystis sp.]|uniref:type II toxin-antitoxin system VapC family toxin n=1 Tax=uncultured Lamprocystis sp. TaxID=543132 RepID=UPI0025E7F02F|nr:type II toxin-antitoxin system VapC family toxin [uncultured Lamprocystis sp.]